MSDTSFSSHPLPSEGSRLYVVSICLIAALGGLLFGYDTAVISGAIGYFKTYMNLTPFWEGWSVGCALLGCVLGAAAAGTASDRWGRKKVLIASAVCFFVSAIGTAIPNDMLTYSFYRILGGLGVGAASMTSPLYIAEISPAKIRGIMVTVYQLAIVIGIFIVYYINYFIADWHTEEWNIHYGWRWMFGSEAIPAFFFLLCLAWVPESPRWLIKQGREEEALDILTRAGGTAHAQREAAEICETIAHEGASIFQLLQPGLRRALAVGVILAVLSQVSGINVFIYYASEIFNQLGFERNAALLQQAIVGTVNLLFTFVALTAVDWFGRKPLLVFGALGMCLAHFCMGGLIFFGYSGVLLLVCVLFFIANFASSYGPVTWVVMSEIYPTRIRGRAMALATLSLWIANYIVSQTFPMLNDNAWLIKTFNHSFPFWVYGSCCLFAMVFSLLFVPETKGRTLEEIETSWNR